MASGSLRSGRSRSEGRHLVCGKGYTASSGGNARPSAVSFQQQLEWQITVTCDWDTVTGVTQGTVLGTFAITIRFA